MPLLIFYPLKRIHGIMAHSGDSCCWGAQEQHQSQVQTLGIPNPSRLLDVVKGFREMSCWLILVPAATGVHRNSITARCDCLVS